MKRLRDLLPKEKVRCPSAITHPQYGGSQQCTLWAGHKENHQAQAANGVVVQWYLTPAQMPANSLSCTSKRHFEVYGGELRCDGLQGHINDHWHMLAEEESVVHWSDETPETTPAPASEKPVLVSRKRTGQS